MANVLAPYPTDLAEPARILLTKLRGGAVSNNEFVHACYQTVGVGLHNTLPDGAGEGMHAARPMKCGPVTDEQAEAALVECCAVRGIGSVLPDGVLQIVISYAVRELMKYLTGTA